MAWGALTALCVCGSAHAATLEMLGVEQLPAADVALAAGEPSGDLEAWGEGAIGRVVEMYRSQGYVAARGWASVEGDAVTLEIDEGQVHRYAFRGASSLEQLTLSDNLVLPGGVLHVPTLESQLEPLRSLHDVVGVSWTVEQGDGWVRTETQGLVKETVLLVSIGKEDPVGVDLDVDFDSLWGVITGLYWGRPSALADRDYMRLGVALAVPLHEYIWEQDPQLRWVYGALSVEYRFRPIGRTKVAPQLILHSSLQQYPRLDRDVSALLVEETYGSLSLHADPGGPIHFIFGATGFRADTLGLALVEGAPDPPPDEDDDYDNSVLRVGLQLITELDFDDGTLREDLRDHAKWTVIADLGGPAPFLRTTLEGQWVQDLWRGQLFLARVRGVFLDGDVRIYDEVRLAGSTQRTTFADAYYVQKAAQAEVAFRWPIRRSLHIGVFYDHSVFEDLSDPAHSVLAWANSFGPSINLLLFDHFALDAYGAVGMGPESLLTAHDRTSRFAQSMYLSFKSVY